MGRLIRKEQIAHDSLYDKSYVYLRDNFHKFKEAVKVKVAIQMLQIFNKDDSKTAVEMKNIIIMNDVVKNNEPLRYNIGQATNAGVAENSGQDRPDTNEA